MENKELRYELRAAKKFGLETIDYLIETREELLWRSGEILSAVAAGELVVNVGARFPLSEAAAAHTALTGRATTGKVLLLP